jgi:hypothetical protein
MSRSLQKPATLGQNDLGDCRLLLQVFPQAKEFCDLIFVFCFVVCGDILNPFSMPQRQVYQNKKELELYLYLKCKQEREEMYYFTVLEKMLEIQASARPPHSLGRRQDLSLLFSASGGPWQPLASLGLQLVPVSASVFTWHPFCMSMSLFSLLVMPAIGLSPP